MFTPDLSNAPQKTKTIRRTNQLPTTGVALAALATTVAAAWQASDLPDLLWLSKADLQQLATDYAQGRDAADAAGDARAPQAQRLQALDKQLNRHVGFVKAYLAEEYSRAESRAYYPEFGFDSASNKLPSARDERVKSLTKLLAALKTHGFEKKKYGTDFWQPLATEYAQLVEESTATAGVRSGIGHKTRDEEQVRQALRALIHHIKANYPALFVARLREFGFQKESY